MKLTNILDFDSFQDLSEKYETLKTNNKTRNILTSYEKTNVIGLRMEQLSFGASHNLDENDLEDCNSVRDVANKELLRKRLPYIIYRPTDNEYWKLKDMIVL